MTRTRLLAALFMTPLAIAGVLFLDTPWLVAFGAVLFLMGLWEWFRLAEDVAAGRLRPEDIDERMLGARTALADLPPPDLFIRTGGDVRVSNFLLWQLAYTELWFTETLWPDVDAATLRQALADYAMRERRFGLTGAQVTTSTPPAPTTRIDE